jgi:Ca2+-binding RTX toxin-like protein
MEELDNFRSKGIRLPLVLVLLVLFVGLLPLVRTLIAQPPDLFVNQSHFDPNLFPHNDSRGMDIIQGNDITDYLLHIPPNTVFTQDCAHPTPPAFIHPNPRLCFGTNGNDKMSGTSASEGIYPQPGDDYVLGNGGSDFIIGSYGKDLIEARDGNDEISGGPDEDRIFAGGGNDSIYVGLPASLKRSLNMTGPPYDILLNLTSDGGGDFKDFVDCGDGVDLIYVDTLDIYKNCESVNGFNPREFIANQTIGDLIHNP